jgi:hypothetical protein
MEEVSRETARALLLLDEAPRLDEARIRVMAGRPSSSPRFFGSFLSLPRAASIALLLTGAAVTALPGSPVRRWMARGWESLTESAQTQSVVEETVEDVGDQTPLSSGAGIPETGAGMLASPQGLEIWIHDLPAEAEIRVVWVEGEEAWIYSGEGTRFNRETDRLEAFSPPGPVRVEIPRTLNQVVVGRNGAILLRKSGGELEIVGRVRQRTPSEIIFGPPWPPNDDQS